MNRAIKLALKFVPPVKETPVAIQHNPVQLVPVPWGKPDPELARAVCWHLVEATPPTLIPANPCTNAALRAFLRSHHIEHQ